MRASDNYIDQLSIDCVIFSYHNGQLKVLIPKLKFKGDFWVLPSGYIRQDEGIDQAAHRILAERTGISDIYLEQFRVFGDVPRSNAEILDRLQALNPESLGESMQDLPSIEWLTQRFISIGYYALVDINKVKPAISEIDESINWYPIDRLPQMIMDHAEQIHRAQEALQLNLDHKLLAFNLLPEKFTMKELQQVYEAVYDRPFRRNNFQKKMLDLGVLERLEKHYTGAAHKAPYLYRLRPQLKTPALA